MIRKNTPYRIKGNSKYFKDKYGLFNLAIIIEDTWMNVSGMSWMCSDGNPAAMATVLTMKGNVDILVTSAKEYLKVLADQRSKADKTVSDANDDISTKEKEVDAMQKQIDNLVAQQKTLKSEIEKEKSDTANIVGHYKVPFQDRTKALKRSEKFVKMVYDIEDAMMSIGKVKANA